MLKIFFYKIKSTEERQIVKNSEVAPSIAFDYKFVSLFSPHSCCNLCVFGLVSRRFKINIIHTTYLSDHSTINVHTHNHKQMFLF